MVLPFRRGPHAAASSIPDGRPSWELSCVRPSMPPAGRSPSHTDAGGPLLISRGFGTVVVTE